MTAFADHNKDYFKANYGPIQEEIAKIPTDLSIYTPESVAALKAAQDEINWELSRMKQEEVDKLAAKLKVARENLKPITYNGSADEEEVRALVEYKPYLDIQTEEISFETKEVAKWESKVKKRIWLKYLPGTVVPSLWKVSFLRMQ